MYYKAILKLLVNINYNRLQENAEEVIERVLDLEKVLGVSTTQELELGFTFGRLRSSVEALSLNGTFDVDYKNMSSVSNKIATIHNTLVEKFEVKDKNFLEMSEVTKYCEEFSSAMEIASQMTNPPNLRAFLENYALDFMVVGLSLEGKIPAGFASAMRFANEEVWLTPRFLREFKRDLEYIKSVCLYGTGISGKGTLPTSNVFGETEETQASLLAQLNDLLKKRSAVDKEIEGVVQKMNKL